MPFSVDGVLQVEFDPAWATCSLVVDGGMWASPVTTITMVRSVPGVADIPVRGVERRPVVDGYFIGSDTEMPLESMVAYLVTGFSAAGTVVGTSSVTVDTSGAACGAWLKVAGQPNLTVRAELVTVGQIESTTQGGVYDIAGGGVVATAVAEASGLNADRLSITVMGETAQQAGAIQAALMYRILLIQSPGTTLFSPGWYFVSAVRRTSRPQATAFRPQDFSLDLVATGIPSGAGQGIAGWSWAGVTGTYPSWTAVMAAHPSWWSLMRGPS